MKSCVSILKLMFVLLLLGAIGAGGYTYYIWNESDELLAEALRNRLHELVPEWNIEFKHVRPDFLGRIRIRDLSLKSADGKTPLLDVDEVILSVDRERLADPMPPLRFITWTKPRLHLVRYSDGRWNFQDLPPPAPMEKNSLPEIHIEHGTVFADFHDDEAGPPARVQIDKCDLRLIPRGARQFIIKAAAKLPISQAVTAEGTWAIDDGTWDMSGQLKNLVLDSALSKLASHVSIDCRKGLARLDSTLARKYADYAKPQVRGPSSVTPQSPLQVGDPIARLGFRAEADVHFRVAQLEPDAPKEYKLSVHLLQGVLTNPPAPFPLSDLRGQIELDNHQIRFREMSAQSGQIHFHVPRGSVLERGDLRPADFDVKISGVPLDDRLPPLLSEAIQKVYRELQPVGEADLVARVEFDGFDRWTHDSDLFIRNGSVVAIKFPYRVDQIQGTLKRRANKVDIALQGRAGLQKVTLNGKILNPGPEAESRFVIETAGIAIDERLRNACPEKVRNVIDNLQAEGDLEGKVILSRAPGPKQPVNVELDARVSDGVVKCRGFPFKIRGISGRFFGSGERWTFEDFTGRHNTAEISVSGDYGRTKTGRLRLMLDFSADGGVFDQDLFDALPETTQTVWHEFNPEGRFHVAGRLYWRPEEAKSFQFAWMSADVMDARFVMNSFRFPISDVSAHAEYKFKDQVIRITKFAGRHDDTTMRFDEGTVTLGDAAEWRVRLERAFVDDLEATPQFRRALPAKLAEVVNVYNPRGKQSISGMIELAGRCGGDYPVTAAWDTETVYNGVTLNAGVELRDVIGKAAFRGQWDGQETSGNGFIKLNSVKIFNKYQLTDVEGPVTLRESRLVLGSEPPDAKDRLVEKDPAKRISAKFIDGLILLDAAVELGDLMKYRLLLNLQDGSLKRYSQLYMSGKNRLSGQMNGNILLRGEGTNIKNLRGVGNLTISRAAIYELPLIVQIFNFLSFKPRDKTAFDTARFLFEIGNGRVRFDAIQLDGDSMKLVGHGNVDFDGKVDLTFASRMGRRTLPIPVFREAVEMTTQGMIGIEVHGTMQDQNYQIRSFPQVDEALRRLFDPRAAQR
jgi:hypothetical protein